MVIEQGWLRCQDENDDEQAKWSNAMAFLDQLQKMKDDKTIPEGPSINVYKVLLSSMETATILDDQAQRLKRRLKNRIHVLTGETVDMKR
jgi:hypothetical protein